MNRIMFIKNDEYKQRLFEGEDIPEIIEITGAPCSGKTTFIKLTFSDKVVLLGGMPLSCGTAKRILYSLFLSVTI